VSDPKPTPLVLVESPFAGDVLRNRVYVAACMADCFRRGEAPFASHALYTLDGVLDDNVPAERTQGIEAGLAWGAKADRTVVYTDFGMSPGMWLGVTRAHKAGRPVEYRTLPSDWLSKCTQCGQVAIRGRYCPSCNAVPL